MLDVLKVEQDIEFRSCIVVCFPSFRRCYVSSNGDNSHFNWCLHRLSPEEYKMALEQEIETQRKNLGPAGHARIRLLVQLLSKKVNVTQLFRFIRVVLHQFELFMRLITVRPSFERT